MERKSIIKKINFPNPDFKALTRELALPLSALSISKEMSIESYCFGGMLSECFHDYAKTVLNNGLPFLILL